MKKLLLFFLLGFGLPFLTFAQINPQDISVEISPELPEPGDRIVVDIQSFVTDLNRAQITWTLDGTELAKAVGQKEVSFTAGSIGTKHTLVITAVTADSGVISKTVTVSPATVDLIWESTNSHVPTFYKGKALNAHEGEVIVQALPYFVDARGAQVNPKSLVYNWKVNNKPQLPSSGFGRDTFRFAGPTLYRATEISVDVESTENDFRARRTITLRAQAPKILFYKQDPLFGKRLLNPISGGTIDLDQDEIIVRAEPYFFSDLGDTRQVQYDWTIDGKEVVTVGDRNILTLRKPEQGEGRSSISLEIKHLPKLLQFARESFTARFQQGFQNGQRIFINAGASVFGN